MGISNKKGLSTAEKCTETYSFVWFGRCNRKTKLKDELYGFVDYGSNVQTTG